MAQAPSSVGGRHFELEEQAMDVLSDILAVLQLQVGYESEAAFSRVFKRYTRMSPAAFRERGARESAPVTDDRRTA